MAAHGDNGNVMVALFTTEEVGEMLNKAVVTVNKEAREIGAGMVKGVSRFYTPDDVEKLHDSFLQKRKPKTRAKSVLQETISWTIFQEHRTLKQDFERLTRLMGEVFNKLTEQMEELKESDKKRDARIWELEKKIGHEESLDDQNEEGA